MIALILWLSTSGAYGYLETGYVFQTPQQATQALDVLCPDAAVSYYEGTQQGPTWRQYGAPYRIVCEGN